MILRFESHVHTNFSDGEFYKFVIRTALKKRIDVIAITDHNTMTGYEFCVRYAKDCFKRNKGKIFILPAEEIACQYGEVLAYGISEHIKRGQPTGEAIDQIHDQGGLAVIPHPFGIITSLWSRARNYPFDGIEIVNFNQFDLFNTLTKRFAKQHPHLFQIGGTDAHNAFCIGLVLNIIDAEPETGSILEALQEKRIRVLHSMEPFPWRAKFFIRNYVINIRAPIRTGLRLQIKCLTKEYLKKKKQKKK